MQLQIGECIMDIGFEGAKADFIKFMDGIFDYSPAFKEFGLRWIKFAKEYPDKYRALFSIKLGDRLEDYFESAFGDLYVGLANSIKQTFSIGIEDARGLLNNMIIYANGYAFFVMESGVDFTDEQISGSLSQVCIGLVIASKLRDGSFVEEQGRAMAMSAISGIATKKIGDEGKDTDGFTFDDVRDSLDIAGIGMWKLIIKEGEPNRLYCDHNMNLLTGLSANISPEEAFVFFSSRVYEEDLATFLSYGESIRKELSEIVYRYNHPTMGLIYVRCGGVVDEKVKGCVCLRGFHQNINATVQIEEQKRRQVTDRAELYRKMSAKLMESFTGTAMYIDLTTLNFKWLSCKVDYLKNAKNGEEMAEIFSRYIADEHKESFFEKISTANLQKVLKEQDEYTFSTYIDYGTGELNRITLWFCVVDENRRYVLGVTRDTTRDYQREQELSNALLEAKRANNAKSNFLNSMSHDIRTPMNAIVGFGELAKKHIDDKEKCLDYISKINSSSEHLLELVNDVLDMSRIESGKMKFLDAKASITSIIYELKTIFETSANERGITFDVKAEGIRNDKVLCDKLRVNQILLNCASNSLKYTESGGKVEISVKQLDNIDDNISQYQFIISDTGIGMSEEFVKTIFDPFTREEGAKNHQIQGTGLGMSICKSIIDMMGGTVEVESEPLKGTSFTIVLPLKIVEDDNFADDENEADDKVIDLKGKRILLVEDNELNQEIAFEILTEVGGEIEIAGNGLIGVEKLKEKPIGYYDAVLMDVQMPVMNGYEATTAIRSMDRADAKDILIIAMTANAFEEDRRQALAVGMNEHIAKPIDVGALFNVLKKHLVFN